jgi:hypothetical protein
MQPCRGCKFRGIVKDNGKVAGPRQLKPEDCSGKFASQNTVTSTANSKLAGYEEGKARFRMPAKRTHNYQARSSEKNHPLSVAV